MLSRNLIPHQAPLNTPNASPITKPTISSKPPTMPSLPRPPATPLLTPFTTFLTAATHTNLYHRALYPPETFLTTRSHNLPIHQSRHPALCAWIADAVASTASQIRSGSARRVAVVLHAPPGDDRAVVERWVFDLEGWPAWPEVPGEGKGKEREVGEEEGGVNWVDVEEGLRGALRRISYAAEKLGPLPRGCTFTLAVELRDEAPAPIGVRTHLALQFCPFSANNHVASPDMDTVGTKPAARLFQGQGSSREDNAPPLRRGGTPVLRVLGRGGGPRGAVLTLIARDESESKPEPEVTWNATSLNFVHSPT